MSEIDTIVAELERLEKEATPGPWETAYHHEWFLDRGAHLDGIPFDAFANDAAFCAYARNHLPAVLAALKEARDEADGKHTALVEVSHVCDSLRAQLEEAREMRRRVELLAQDNRTEFIAKLEAAEREHGIDRQWIKDVSNAIHYNGTGIAETSEGNKVREMHAKLATATEALQYISKFDGDEDCTGQLVAIARAALEKVEAV